MRGFDVVVVGGGPAGVVAATQAGRAGVRTLLVEKTSSLGGTTVNAGINRPGLFHAWGRQIIAGIGWELVERCVREGGGAFPDFEDTSLPHYKHQPFVDHLVYTVLCDQFVMEAPCELQLHTMIADVQPEADGSWLVRLCGKSGTELVSAAQLVDCSGDANVVALAGLPIRSRMETQPATLDFELDGYDFERLDLDAINRAFRESIASGEVQATDGTWKVDQPDLSGLLLNRGRNANHIVVEGVDASTSSGRTAYEVEGRRSVRRLVDFLRRQPGTENLRVVRVAPEVGIRETVTIEGEVTITVDDYREGRLWEDAIAYSFYPIDLHGVDSASWNFGTLEDGRVPTVPRQALLPVGSRNLLVAGRCVSSDRYANSALRVQASAMAMGQAAGALASLAAMNDCDPRHVAQSEVTLMLENHQAIVPEV